MNKNSQVLVIVLGIIGNLLVITSILRQKNMLKNNYYFLVLHLALCDLGALLIYLLDDIDIFWVEKELYFDSTMYCIFGNIFYVFQVAGIVLMLIISVLRYRATVHPLKPTISRRKLKVVCGLMYFLGFILGYGPVVPSCWNNIKNAYLTYHWNYIMLCYYIFPSTFMAVVYFKISRALFQQNRYMKSLCSSNVSARCTKFCLQYTKIYPKSKSCFHLPWYRSMLCNRKYSHHCSRFLVYDWRVS